MDIHYDIVLLKEKKWQGLQAVIISCFSQSLFAVTFYLSAKGLHQDIRFIYFLIFVPFICVAGSLPSIGGLGVREFGAKLLFGKIGVEAGIAVSISLLNFLFMVIVGLLGGLFYVITLSSRRLQHHPSAAPAGSRDA